tara:strand:- start:319 stop:1461 length:1143 start_codon:yes stop_codon:yes gene_type:complete
MRTLLGMQYGGGVPQQLQDGGVSSGLAYLRRGKARKKAYDKARDAEGRLIEKRKKGGFWGSLGGLGGGLLGAALVGSGLGIPLALAAGLGTAGGRYLGSKAGYGKDFEVEDDVMYGEEAGLGDIGAAGESYESGMGQEAILSGVKAGLMAGISPGGGIYGKTSKWAEGLGGVGGAEVLAPTEAYKASLGFDLPTSSPQAPSLDMTSAYGTGLNKGTLTETMPTSFSVPEGISDSTALSINPDRNLGILSKASAISNLPTQPPTPPMSTSAVDSSVTPIVEGNWLLEHGAKNPVSSGGGTSEVISDVTPSLDSNNIIPSYADALANRGQYQNIINQFFQQYSPAQRSEQNWMSMFEQPQLAGLMGGGTVLKNPRTLLGFVG